MKKLIILLLWLGMIISNSRAQISGPTCNCEDYLYLNEPRSGNGVVHKFRIAPNGSFTEISNGQTGTTPWFPQNGGLPKPHGLATDLNGNLYISEKEEGPIRRLNCAGEITPLSNFTLSSTSAPALANIGGFNFTSRGNTLYVNNTGSDRITSYDLCTGNEIGYVKLAGIADNNGVYTFPNLQDWGFHIDKNGTFYASVGFFDDVPPVGMRGIYRFTPTDANFANHTTYSPIISITEASFPIPVTKYNVWGITTDNNGNMFVVVEEWGGTIDRTWILKYDSAGTLVKTTFEEVLKDKKGYEWARGIVYLNTTDKLYLAGGPNGDCVAIVNPSTLAYEGAAVGNVPGQDPKGLALNVECCPAAAKVTMDTVVCNASIGQKINLRSLLSCKGIICEGSWTPTIQTGITYNDCDQTITIDSSKACGEFKLQGTGGNGSYCGAFEVILKLEASVLTPVSIKSNQTVCKGETAASITIASGGTSSTNSVTYQWQKSTISCTSGFTNIDGANANTYTPPALTQTTYYRLIVKTVSTCSSKNCETISNCTTITVINPPNAGSDGNTSVCDNSTAAINLFSLITGEATGGIWSRTTGTGGTFNAAAGTFIPAAGATTSTFTYTLTGTAPCGNDASVATVTVNPKPNAGTDQTLTCVNAQTNTLKTSTTLVPSPTGGTWGQIGTAPAPATINGNAVSGMSVAGTYRFIYTLNGCKDTVAVTVVPCAGCVKPNAGPNITLTCPPSGITPTTATLTPVTAGGIWAAQTDNPATATVTGNNVSGLTLAGTYKFIYSVTSGGEICTDTVQVIVPTCIPPKGSLGDFVWKDTNNNGIQDETGTGVAGVQIELYKVGTASAIAKDTTNASGKYLFSNLDAGQYYIKVLAASLPAGCSISTKKDVTTGGGTEANDSDVDPTSGQSGNYTIDPLDPAKKNILTVDAALVVPCVKSSITVTAAPVCSADVQTYSLTFSIANKVGTIKVNKGILSGSNPYSVTGIPSGATVKITDSLSAVCKFDTLITGPNCNCNPKTPTLITPSLTACIGDTFPTLKATVIGLATVEWFTQATGGTAVATGLNYKPTGLVAAVGATYYAQARSTDPTCPSAISTSRVMATINAQDCMVDLALKKSINTKIAQIGDVLTYTLKVWNESANNATGVEVTDSIATTVQFQTGSFTASRGSAVISGNVIKWNISNIAAAGVPANGDTVTLTYQVKATQEGVHFNTAEICKTNEKDVDSTPCNHDDDEDDIDRQCFTVPFKLCPGEKVQATVPSTYTNVQWFKDNGTTPVVSGNTVMLSEVGSYRFTATNQTCPASGCCPIIIEAGVNCCVVDLCIPFTINKRKK